MTETGGNNKDLGRAAFDPSRVRSWLVGLTKYGEDNVWRGAQKALAYLDHLEAELEHARKPRWGEAGYQPPAPDLHAYKPHRKWPWFCAECGYPDHERLKHFSRDSSPDSTAPDPSRGEA